MSHTEGRGDAAHAGGQHCADWPLLAAHAAGRRRDAAAQVGTPGGTLEATAAEPCGARAVPSSRSRSERDPSTWSSAGRQLCLGF